MMVVNSELYKPDEKASTYQPSLHFKGSNMFHLRERAPNCYLMAVAMKKSLGQSECTSFSVWEACSQHDNPKPGEQRGKTERSFKFVKEVDKSLWRHKLKPQVLQIFWPQKMGTPIPFFSPKVLVQLFSNDSSCH